MSTKKISIFFLIILSLILFIFLSNQVFATTYQLSSSMFKEFASISKKAGILYIIRKILLFGSIFSLIIVVGNMDRLKESNNLKIILIVAILALGTNFFISRTYISENSIFQLYQNYATNDFCYLYNGELLTFRFEENNQNVILVCQKNKFEKTRINKTIESILRVMLSKFNLPPSLYNSLTKTNSTSDFVKFEENPIKTDFEKSILDDSYVFIRITFNEELLTQYSNTQ